MLNLEGTIKSNMCRSPPATWSLDYMIGCSTSSTPSHPLLPGPGHENHRMPDTQCQIELGSNVRLPEKTQDRLPDKLSERISDKMSEHMSNRSLEYMSDKMLGIYVSWWGLLEGLYLFRFFLGLIIPG